MDVAVKRWQAFTGLEAKLDGDGRSFEEIALERAAQDRRPEPASRVDDADHTGCMPDWHPVGPASKFRAWRVGAATRRSASLEVAGFGPQLARRREQDRLGSAHRR